MRDTEYAKELASVSVGGATIERLYIKEEEQEEIRFSWWKDGRLMMRPLDVTEATLLELLEQAFSEDIFTDGFKLQLIKFLLR